MTIREAIIFGLLFLLCSFVVGLLVDNYRLRRDTETLARQIGDLQLRMTLIETTKK